MKQTFRSVCTLFFASLLILVSCKKPVEPNQPGGGPGPRPGLSHKYRIAADALPGLPNQPVANLFAKFDVKNAQDELVVSNKLAAISFNGKFITEEMELPAGSYRISKLMIVSGTGNVLYAVPVANSVKATAVTKPLAYPMVLPAATSLNVAAEFLKVEATDKAVDFGYADDAFGNSNTPDETTALSVKMKVVVKVGEILYDSIPGSLVYRTFSATNELLSVKFISLAARTNTVQLDKNAERHEFIVKKWGVDYVKQVTKAEVRNDALYVFGEEKEAKKLKSELTYMLVGDTYKAESKNSYIYNSKGQLTKIEYYIKRSTDNSPYLSKTDLFDYNNNKVEKISSYDEHNAFTAATSFSYDGEGKVNHITADILNGNKTNVTVSYLPANSEDVSEVTMQYSYSHTSITMNYFQRWNAGNRFSENSQTSNQNTETGEFDHDSNINPYAHMNWPNLFLSNGSKNNMTRQYRTYYGSYPTNVAYSFEYKYDNEGYPVELIRRYKSYLTGQHLFTTKTVYNY